MASITDNSKIEIMENEAREQGYEIKTTTSPYFNKIHAVKDNVDIFIANLCGNPGECKVRTLEDFRKELKDPAQYNIDMMSNY